MIKTNREPAGEMPDASASRLRVQATGQGSRPQARIPISYDQGRIEIQGRLRADMLDPAATLPAQEVKTQTVALRIYLTEQSGAQQHPLVRRDLDLEDRKLHPLSIVLASATDAAQPSGTAR